MSPIRKYIIKLIEALPEDKLEQAIDFIQFMSSNPTELDDYDYEIAKKADKITKDKQDTIPLEDVCKELGIDISELQA